MENRLKHEQSPYLLQHKDNPIFWNAWNDKSHKLALKQNKIIFLSIGYSTCHWCHVMEKECFEDAQVAEILNRSFICIKVDREERPDIDQIYMNSIQLLGNQGGWPLTVFLTPDRLPFWGGTYFPKIDLIRILEQIEDKWVNNPSSIHLTSSSLLSYLDQNNQYKAHDELSLKDNLFDGFIKSFHDNFDWNFGGIKGNIKFPSIMNPQLLMSLAVSGKFDHEKDKLQKMLDRTLMGMFKGGLYDHLGGGFFRYSTDERWFIPHFEKMLYDNGLLAYLYLEAYTFTKNSLYLNVGLETLDYILEHMTSSLGGFMSAQDADSQGVEGKFYLWTYEELAKLLTRDEFELIREVYNIREAGHLEGKLNHLNLLDTTNTIDVFSKEIKRIRKKLCSFRISRVHPFKDDKILTAWNGLTLKAFCKGYQITKDKRYLKQAEKNFKFIKNNLHKEGNLYRRYRNGKTDHLAYLDDFTYLIAGLLELYQTNFNEEIFHWILSLQKEQDEKLWSEKHEVYLFARKRDDHITTTIDLQDGDKPNPNGVAILNLLMIYDLTYEESYLLKARSILKRSIPYAAKYPLSFSSIFKALSFYLQKRKQVAIIGSLDHPRVKDFLDDIYTNFFPFQVLALNYNDHSSTINILEKKKMINNLPTFYICVDRVCLEPSN